MNEKRARYNTTQKDAIADSGMQCAILTIDVEDNFTREELLDPKDWTKYEAQVVTNTELVINTLKEINAKATFFVLGKVAERHPQIVRVIQEAGHDLASHGYAHIPASEMTEKEFRDDVAKSLDILNSHSNTKVTGFRARSFSINERKAGNLSILKDCGILYDSSILNSKIKMLRTDVIREYPVNSIRFLRKDINISGGIFLRLLPSWLYSRLLKFDLKRSRHIMIYCHVWEFNKDQPKRKVGIIQRLAQTPISFTTERKIRNLSNKYSFISIKDYAETIDRNTA